MKISRRGLAGVAAGAMAAVQSPKPNIEYDILNEAKQQIPNSLYADTPASSKTDPEYYSKQIKHCKKILSGDFSDCMYQFEDNNRDRIYHNIEALKSISATARQSFIENAENRRTKRKLIENAKIQLDCILGLPFSVTGILFDE